MYCVKIGSALVLPLKNNSYFFFVKNKQLIGIKKSFVSFMVGKKKLSSLTKALGNFSLASLF